MAKESAERGGNFNAMKFRIPEGVREAIGIRLNKLSDDCNEMLQTAAVIGREFDFTLLSMLKSEDSDKDELTLLEEAVAAATVREVPGQRNRYEFTHALFQQTLVEELTTGRRVRLHARVVDSMEQLYPENLSEHATEMLHHCTEGVVSANKIANYAQLAAVHAAHLNAWAEARAYCEQALEALGDRSPDFQRADILSLLGRGELLTFSYPDLQRGWNHVASAFKIYDDFEDHESAVSLIQRARGYRPIWLHSTAEVFLRALEMVEPNSEDAGYLLVQQAQALRFEEMDHDGAASALDRALAIAVESGNKHLETRVLLGLAANGGRDGDAEGAVELRRRAAVLAQETEQPVEEAEARRAVLTQLITEGDAGDSNRNIEEILELERLFGFETAIVFEQLRIALVSGNLENTRYFGELADRDHAGDSVIRILAGLGGWHRGDTTDLDSRFDDAHEESQFAPTLWQRASNASFLSLVAWNTNRPDDAVKAGDVVKSVISRPKLIPEIETFARIALSMSAILTGDKVEAAEQYKHLSRGRDSISGTTYYLAGDRILGALAKTAGMFDKSAAHFEDALVFCSDPSYRMEATWSCHGYAEMLLETISSSKRTEKSTSDLERAKEVLILGLNHARDIGTHPLESLLIALQEKAAALGATRPTRPDGLTNREVDVLRLIASGRSNQQISDELVVTLSTTASHVANILGKTDSSNRTEAAAYAMRHGLV
jgi:DNA-binding CsgD family transcriptional regulator/tetratricopeptide (TPR) repeat protein